MILNEIYFKKLIWGLLNKKIHVIKNIYRYYPFSNRNSFNKSYTFITFFNGRF